jgi:hypothetical protein
MLNKDVNVPDNTIAVFNYMKQLFDDPDRVHNIISKPDKKRDWFTPHFYRCLPLTVGNQYGFIIKSEYDFSFEWDGGDSPDSLKVYSEDESCNNYSQSDLCKGLLPEIKSHFGSGIITINLPIILRTPPGINLLTMNPPNIILPNITVMTGVVEADNLRHDFTINLRVQTPNVRIFIPKGTPIAGLIPIPRYFVENFNLVNAEDIFDEQTLEEENFAKSHFSEYKNKMNTGLNNHYKHGTDVYGNKFLDHQGPTLKKFTDKD